MTLNDLERRIGLYFTLFRRFGWPVDSKGVSAVCLLLYVCVCVCVCV